MDSGDFESLSKKLQEEADVCMLVVCTRNVCMGGPLRWWWGYVLEGQEKPSPEEGEE
jgi:hypothetical protein